MDFVADVTRINNKDNSLGIIGNVFKSGCGDTE